MDTRVQPTVATSAEERARALQPLIDRDVCSGSFARL
jgi:hypothetical protein